MKDLFLKFKKFINVATSKVVILSATLFCVSYSIMAQDSSKSVLDVVSYLMENKAVILGFLLALSELLSLSDKVKANGLFQLLLNFLKSVKK